MTLTNVPATFNSPKMARKTKHTDLVEESDRGCVLAAAAMLEESLEKIFCAIFESQRASKTVQNSLFDSNGPLATFSAKIKLAYALGLISSDAYEDLERIRKLRNEAAHTAKDFDFLNDSVGARLESLHRVQAFRASFKRYGLKYRRSAKRPKGKRRADESDSNVRVGPASQAQLRVGGFLKYRKAIFALGVGDLVFSLDTGTLLGEIPRTLQNVVHLRESKKKQGC
jgi:DNA-binding MltR family transcriptional regulator